MNKRPQIPDDAPVLEPEPEDDRPRGLTVQNRQGHRERGTVDRRGRTERTFNEAPEPDPEMYRELERAARDIHAELDLMPGYGKLFLNRRTKDVFWIAGDGD